jgi:hypothetical protein
MMMRKRTVVSGSSLNLKLLPLLSPCQEWELALRSQLQTSSVEMTMTKKRNPLVSKCLGNQLLSCLLPLQHLPKHLQNPISLITMTMKMMKYQSSRCLPRPHPN